MGALLQMKVLSEVFCVEKNFGRSSSYRNRLGGFYSYKTYGDPPTIEDFRDAFYQQMIFDNFYFSRPTSLSPIDFLAAVDLVVKNVIFIDFLLDLLVFEKIFSRDQTLSRNRLPA